MVTQSGRMAHWAVAHLLGLLVPDAPQAALIDVMVRDFITKHDLIPAERWPQGRC